jgi:hypothetical protein
MAHWGYGGKLISRETRDDMIVALQENLMSITADALFERGISPAHHVIIAHGFDLPVFDRRAWNRAWREVQADMIAQLRQEKTKYPFDNGYYAGWSRPELIELIDGLDAQDIWTR